jgi:hypothetical protein
MQAYRNHSWRKTIFLGTVVLIFGTDGLNGRSAAVCAEHPPQQLDHSGTPDQFQPSRLAAAAAAGPARGTQPRSGGDVKMRATGRAGQTKLVISSPPVLRLQQFFSIAKSLIALLA